MVFKIFLLVAFLGYARSSVVPLHTAPLQEVIKTEYNHNPQYAYAYDVQDTNTGDFKSQHEVRSGDVVKGSYSLIDPDGTKRTVDYTADDVNGFNAVVRKEPITNSAAPLITPVVAKVDVNTPVIAKLETLETPLVTKVQTPVVTKIDAPVVTKIETPVVTNVDAPVITNFETPAIAPAKYITVADTPVKYYTPYNTVAAPVKYIASPYNVAIPAPYKYVEPYTQAISFAKYEPTVAVEKYIPENFPNPVAVAKLNTEVVSHPYSEVAPVKYVAADDRVAYAAYSNPFVNAPYPYPRPYVAYNDQVAYVKTASYTGPVVGKIAYAPVIAKYSSPYNEIW